MSIRGIDSCYTLLCWIAIFKNFVLRVLSHAIFSFRKLLKKEKCKVVIDFWLIFFSFIYSFRFYGLFARIFKCVDQLGFGLSLDPENLLMMTFRFQIYLWLIAVTSQMTCQGIWNSVKFVLAWFKDSLLVWNQVEIVSSSDFVFWKRL